MAKSKNEMKRKYKDHDFQSRTLVLIDQANRILEDYHSQGYRLTLRQVYYQLVASNLIPNNKKSYNRLKRTLVNSRMAGLTDWSHMEDRTRGPDVPSSWENIAAAFGDLHQQYRRDRQENQSCRIEIWTEKDAVSNILREISHPLHITLEVCKGDSSVTAQRDGALRFIKDGRPGVVLYLGDHDPSGLRMREDLVNKFDLFGADVLFDSVALTIEQVRKYDLPPNFVKDQDSNTPAYVEEFGSESWELDALKPDQLKAIISEAVEEHMDRSEFDEAMRREDEDRARMSEIIEDL